MFWNSREPPTTCASFNPQADITLSELARIVKGLHPGPISFRQDAWDHLSPEIKRHFWPVGGTP